MSINEINKFIQKNNKNYKIFLIKLGFGHPIQYNLSCTNAELGILSDNKMMEAEIAGTNCSISFQTKMFSWEINVERIEKQKQNCFRNKQRWDAARNSGRRIFAGGISNIR